MPTNETFASYNSSICNDVADYVDPLYHHHWQSQSHHPSNNHHIYSTYQSPALASHLVSSDQAINPLVTVSTTSASSTDRGLNPGQRWLILPQNLPLGDLGDFTYTPLGLKHHPPVPEGNFDDTEHTRSDFPELEFPGPEPSSSVAPIRAVPLSINGPVSTEGEAGTFPNNYPARFASLDTTDVYQYGNDTRFEPNGYVSLSDQEATDGSELNQMSLLKCLERTDSVENTRSSSPELKRQAQHSNSRVPDLQPLKIPSETLVISEKNQNQQTSSSSGSRKRQRGITSCENEWQFEDSVRFGQNNEKIESGKRGPRSFKMFGDQKSPAGDISPSKRPKYTRCNLSDDQKKANHTKAEQERRNAIKKNLSELIELVPGLKSEKLNKCQSIICISDWLEKLAEDNKKLTIKLKELLGEKAFNEASMRASSGRGQ